MQLFGKSFVAVLVLSGSAALSTFGAKAQTYTGKASYYSSRHRTANNGHVGSFTCAHRSLPFGSRLLVTNLANHKSAVLTVNDRGPFTGGRILDIAAPAARFLGFISQGVAKVRIETL